MPCKKTDFSCSNIGDSYGTILNMLYIKFKSWMDSTKKEVFWKKDTQKLSFFPGARFLVFRSPTVYVYVLEQYAFSVSFLICWAVLNKLVHGPLGQSNKHPTLDFCLDHATKEFNPPKQRSSYSRLKNKRRCASLDFFQALQPY